MRRVARSDNIMCYRSAAALVKLNYQNIINIAPSPTGPVLFFFVFDSKYALCSRCPTRANHARSQVTGAGCGVVLWTRCPGPVWCTARALQLSLHHRSSTLSLYHYSNT